MDFIEYHLVIVGVPDVSFSATSGPDGLGSFSLVYKAVSLTHKSLQRKYAYMKFRDL